MARMRITHVSEVAQLVPVSLPGSQAHGAGEQPALRQHSRAAQTPPSDPTPERSARATGRWQRLSRRMSGERRRMTFALLLSLLIHTLLFSMAFGDQEHGLPGFAFPWRDRRTEVPDLRIVLVPAPTPPASPAPPPPPPTVVNVPAAKPPAQAKPKRSAVAPAAPAKAPPRADGPDHTAPRPQILESAVVEVEPLGFC